MSSRDRIDRAERELEGWLQRHAENGVSELVLVGLLREYAIDIETLGYIPRRTRLKRQVEDRSLRNRRKS